MNDEVTIEGISYVSSKRASELSEYAQDYIGQLARGGYIDCQRIGGLWYVSMSSLLQYKEQAEKERPTPPEPKIHKEPESLVFFDGKEFISASRASKLCGYTQDYVGQLARAGKILSRQVGNRWYVDREGILAHKKEKDSLLAAVQKQSVGVAPIAATFPPVEIKKEVEKSTDLHFIYSSESTDLLPIIPREINDEEGEMSEKESNGEEIRSVPIRVIESKSDEENDLHVYTKQELQVDSVSNNTVAQGQFYRRFAGSLSLIVAVLAVGGVSVWGVGNYMSSRNSTTQSQFGVVSMSGNQYFDTITRSLERILVSELLYKRK